MISRNLRHLRGFLAIAETGSVTLSANLLNLSQPAVTQALTKLEASAGGALFTRTRQGFFVTERGRVLRRRLERAFGFLDAALRSFAPPLPRRVTSAQLTALIAVRDAENFTLAARQAGLAQPTLHRAVTQLEQAAGTRLFQRAAHGLIARPGADLLAQAARLAFAELDQADADLAEFDRREGGRIVIGALPLSRSVLLPQALAAFRSLRPRIPLKVIDGPYSDLLAGLRRGAIDLIVGALRYPAPIDDVVQETLFQDRLAMVCRPDHPLAGQGPLTAADLAPFPWIVPRAGTPLRAQFDAFFARNGAAPPVSIIEAGSVLLMRETLFLGDMLGCISGLQAKAEIARGLLVRLDAGGDWPERAIGMTTRANWAPTQAQSDLLTIIRQKAAALSAPQNPDPALLPPCPPHMAAPRQAQPLSGDIP